MHAVQNTTLLLASRNRKKLREIAELLNGLDVTLVSAADFPEAPEVEETGRTFAENAALKAGTVAAATGHWTIADDSGLAVDALDGAPGVYSARYAGEQSNDRQNNEKLLAQLRDVPDERRGAQFVCCLALADPAGAIRLHVEGRCRGQLLHEPRGQNGFGYDPLFWIPEYRKTFAELTLTAKSVLSHRARAFEKLLGRLAGVLAESK
ncbi:MAG: XTP/dITP diphosphatase [Candidatus Anammoximicrobium sp.]|nr:XTP/dITP diphosphatase [Candidatus Anammoximicrobium sp.]